MSTINIGELLSASIDVAQRAGKIIKGVYEAGQLGKTVKGLTAEGVEDPVTVADTGAQHLVISDLLAAFPNLKIIGEEDVYPPASKNRPRLDLVDLEKVPHDLRAVPIDRVVVFLDPLDATKEFTMGQIECVTTLIGISVGGIPVAGVINQVFNGENGRLVHAIVGGEVHGLEGAKRTEKGVVLVTTASHSNERVENSIKLVKPDKVMRVGGAGYKSLLVLDGIADVYCFPTPGCKLWDTCAADAIITAAKGRLTDMYGRKIKYGADIPVMCKDGVLVTIAEHDKFVDLLSTLPTGK